jgi:hypothetical protein
VRRCRRVRARLHGDRPVLRDGRCRRGRRSLHARDAGRADVGRVRRRHDRRRRGVVADPAVRSRRIRRVRRHDRRRRRANPSPARRAALADPHAPRRVARARRGGRRALGLGGGDLRPLRIRPRLVRRRDRDPARVRRVQRTARAAWTHAPGRAGGGARGLSAALGRACGAPARDGHARAGVVGAPRHRGPGGPSRRRGPKALRTARGGRRGARLRDLPPPLRLRERLVDEQALGRRGGRRGTHRDGRRLALPPRRRLDEHDRRRLRPARPPVVLPPRPAAADAVPDGRRPLGAPARRGRGALGEDVCRRGRGRARGAGRALPVERRTVAPVGGRCRAD